MHPQKTMSCGVMVAHRILVPLVWVRVLTGQQKSLIFNKLGFFVSIFISFSYFSNFIYRYCFLLLAIVYCQQIHA